MSRVKILTAYGRARFDRTERRGRTLTSERAALSATRTQFLELRLVRPILLTTVCTVADVQSPTAGWQRAIDACRRGFERARRNPWI
jgi:hypothetical protein